MTTSFEDDVNQFYMDWTNKKVSLYDGIRVVVDKELKRREEQKEAEIMRQAEERLLNLEPTFRQEDK